MFTLPLPFHLSLLCIAREKLITIKAKLDRISYFTVKPYGKVNDVCLVWASSSSQTSRQPHAPRRSHAGAEGGSWLRVASHLRASLHTDFDDLILNYLFAIQLHVTLLRYRRLDVVVDYYRWKPCRSRRRLRRLRQLRRLFVRCRDPIVLLRHDI